MKFKIVPVGARVYVEEIIPTDDVTARMNALGLTAVVAEENKPAPTEGVVVAIGSDPLIQELVTLGDHIFFSRHAGIYQTVQGKQYRCLTLDEIISVLKLEPDTEAAPEATD